MGDRVLLLLWLDDGVWDAAARLSLESLCSKNWEQNTHNCTLRYARAGDGKFTLTPQLLNTKTIRKLFK